MGKGMSSLLKELLHSDRASDTLITLCSRHTGVVLRWTTCAEVKVCHTFRPLDNSDTINIYNPWHPPGPPVSSEHVNHSGFPPKL